ncbi:MAG: hypothetical protein M3P48_01745 [Actinomycetota bacterium]|nr:hypothetical protein [Actinomycetota bacterium]
MLGGAIRTLRLAVIGAAALLLGISLIVQGSLAGGVVVTLLGAGLIGVLVSTGRRLSFARRGSQRGTPTQYAILFGLLAVGTAIAAGWNYLGHNAELRGGGGETATGTVVDIDNRRRAADVAVVEFSTSDGTRVRARTPIDRRPARGSRVRVEYVPDDPEKARIVGNWSPAYERLSFVIAATLLGAAVAGAVGAVQRSRKRVSST